MPLMCQASTKTACLTIAAEAAWHTSSASISGVAPPLLDLAELERLVTADELYQLEDDCTEHDGCRPIRLR